MICDIAIDLNHVQIYGTANKETLLNGRLYLTGSKELLFDSSLDDQPEGAPALNPPLFLALKNVSVQSNETAQQIVGKTILRYNDIAEKSFQSDDWVFEEVEMKQPTWFLYKAGHLFPEEYKVLE